MDTGIKVGLALYAMSSNLKFSSSINYIKAKICLQIKQPISLIRKECFPAF